MYKNYLLQHIVWMDMRTQNIVERLRNKKIPNCHTLEEKKR